MSVQACEEVEEKRVRRSERLGGLLSEEAVGEKQGSVRFPAFPRGEDLSVHSNCGKRRCVSMKGRAEGRGCERTALLDRHAVPRVLVVGREAGCAPQEKCTSAAMLDRRAAPEGKALCSRRTRVRRPGGNASGSRLLEGVEALAVSTEAAHGDPVSSKGEQSGSHETHEYIKCMARARGGGGDGEGVLGWARVGEGVE